MRVVRRAGPFGPAGEAGSGRTRPPKYTFGNAGRNSVRGPGFASFDLAVSKRLQVRGRTAVTIGLQTFNLFNRASFDLPEHFVDEPSIFGRIFSAKAPRQLQLMARLGF